MELLRNVRRAFKEPGAARREERLVREYPTKVKPDGWGTTDPLNHDPDNYRYLVHTTSISDIVHRVRMHSGIRIKEPSSPSEMTALLADFTAHDSISCTLVDEIYRAAYKWRTLSLGLILDVPEENIVAIDRSDLGTWMCVTRDRSEREKEYFFKRGSEMLSYTPTAQDFIQNCRDDDYNEVLVDGIGNQGRKIRISGVFLITDPVLGTPLNRLDPKRMRNEVAQREMDDVSQILQIPIVPLPAPFQESGY